MIKSKDYRQLFNSMHPDFGEDPEIAAISSDEIFDEMLLDLRSYDADSLRGTCPDNVTFGYYEGSREKLLSAVSEVLEAWVDFFDEKETVYCAYVNDEIASFCIVEDMGLHNIENCPYRIGGPGCVGTLPKYRNMGIGRELVRRVTQIFRDKGYDYSYIHYTSVPEWYATLGYRTIMKWNRHGTIGFYEAVFLNNDEVSKILYEIRKDAPFPHIPADFHITTEYKPGLTHSSLYGSTVHVHIVKYKKCSIAIDDEKTTSNEGLKVVIRSDNDKMQALIDSLDKNYHITGSYMDGAKYTDLIDFTDGQKVDIEITGIFGCSYSNGIIDTGSKK